MALKMSILLKVTGFETNTAVSVAVKKNIIQFVIPAKAGIHYIDTFLDPCFRRDDSMNRSV